MRLYRRTSQEFYVVVSITTGEITIRGPKDVTVTVGGNVFMECIVMGAPGPTPFWCISGKTYTPSTLPDRFLYNSTGLIIYPVVLEDNGLVVQCSIDIIDITTFPFSVTTINSSIGVVHVVADAGSLSITTGNFYPQVYELYYYFESSVLKTELQLCACTHHEVYQMLIDCFAGY